jgi:hypothetical protein
LLDAFTVGFNKFFQHAMVVILLPRLAPQPSKALLTATSVSSLRYRLLMNSPTTGLKARNIRMSRNGTHQ